MTINRVSDDSRGEPTHDKVTIDNEVSHTSINSRGEGIGGRIRIA